MEGNKWSQDLRFAYVPAAGVRRVRAGSSSFSIRKAWKFWLKHHAVD